VRQVLFCTEPLDELCVMELKEFGDKEIVDLSKDSVKGIDDDEDKKKAKEEAQTDYQKTLSFLTSALGDKKISKAEVSTALSDSPAGTAATPLT
jgi:HSP90 family molecular chaperone